MYNREPKKRLIGPRTIKTALAFGIIFITYNLIGRNYDPTLACLAVLVCMEDSVIRSIKNGVNRMFGTLVGAFVGYFFVLWQPDNKYLRSVVITILVALIIASCSYFARTGLISMAVITFMNIAIFYASAVSSTLNYVIERTLSTIFGIVLAIVINKFLFNPSTHTAIPRKPGVVFKLNGAHYLYIKDRPVLITNCDYSLSSEFEQGENREARTALEIMLCAARRSGVELVVLAGFRPYIEQRRQKKNKSECRDPHLALAGHSEHGAGLAYDIGNGGALDFTIDFARTEEYRWLHENAAYYGFIERYPAGKIEATGFEFEPWHYRYVGVDTAVYIKNSGKAIEEFILPEAK